MKKITLSILLAISTLIINAQSVDSGSFNLETNINLVSKTRSYAVPTGEKFVSTRYFLGWDLSLYFSQNSYQMGIEYFPYKHLNAFVGKEVYSFSNFKLIPNIKYGYSFDLQKQYTGIGIKVQYKKVHLNFHRTLHFKTGDSKYWGDGITCFSFGYRFSVKK